MCLQPPHTCILTRPALFLSDATFPKPQVFRVPCCGFIQVPTSCPCYLPGPTVYDRSHWVSNTPNDLPYTLSGCLPLLPDKTPTLDHATIHLLCSRIHDAEGNWRKSMDPPTEATTNSRSQASPGFSAAFDKHFKGSMNSSPPENLFLNPAAPPH